ncbi:hypothetical protein WICPIJ_009343 [Wickerhamomyces pijperi]|uniref:Uncharacterized protein n=1 Tax=Wickerhamomyces pijperi TaxID=599730 RepID=A0A9P8PNS1_WICPI|nr:hypothetical protein WICPIJ_009343 [Wickerhamomyces pijperi]
MRGIKVSWVLWRKIFFLKYLLHWISSQNMTKISKVQLLKTGTNWFPSLKFDLMMFNGLDSLSHDLSNGLWMNCNKDSVMNEISLSLCTVPRYNLIKL